MALVTFADAPGVRFVTNIVGDGGDRTAGEVNVGDRVEPLFPAPGADQRLVMFRPSRRLTGGLP